MHSYNDKIESYGEWWDALLVDPSSQGSPVARVAGAQGLAAVGLLTLAPLLTLSAPTPPSTPPSTTLSTPPASTRTPSTSLVVARNKRQKGVDTHCEEDVNNTDAAAEADAREKEATHALGFAHASVARAKAKVECESAILADRVKVLAEVTGLWTSLHAELTAFFNRPCPVEDLRSETNLARRHCGYNQDDVRTRTDDAEYAHARHKKARAAQEAASIEAEEANVALAAAEAAKAEAEAAVAVAALIEAAGVAAAAVAEAAVAVA
jgi:hypothetical protein